MDIVASIRRKLEESRENYSKHEQRQFISSGLGKCLESLSERIEFESASIYVNRRRKRILEQVCEFGGGINFINKIEFENGPGLSAYVAKKQKPIYLADIHRGSRHGQAPIRSYLSQPILHNDDVLGVLNLAHTTANAFERREMVVIKSFIENVKPILETYQRYSYGYRAFTKDGFNRR